MTPSKMQNKGETLTFFQLLKDKNWRIEIPIIQRDYAQGREKSKDIRDLFLANLHEHLETETRIDLDFVYGSVTSNGNTMTFVPLDGQQRLTTLFLLHWYLANKDGEFSSFKEVITTNHKSLFTYETRVSSREFCDGLANTQINFNELMPPDEGLENGLSKTIRDLPWYFTSWDNDPTVKSIMTMLDDIHLTFKLSEGFYTRLIRDEVPVISFQFLNLEAFELTDDLYIKMNARGKLLSPFENFKAWLQNYIEENKIKLSELQWELNLDIKWMNMFWDYKGEQIEDVDNSYYNFFKNIGLYQYLLEKGESKQGLNRELIDALDNKERITLKSFEDTKYFRKESLDFIFQSLNTLYETGFSKINMLLSEIFQKPSLKGTADIAQMIVGKDNNPTLPNRVFVYSLLVYITSVEEKDNQNYEKNFKRWMRVCYNLIFNTYIQNPDNLANAILSINKLSTRQESIYEYLSSEAAEITFFNINQRDEEIYKAKLITADPAWEEYFIKYESHSYFNGQIGFILKLANTDNLSPLNFIPYAEKSAALFSPNILDHPDFLFQRALLSKKNYFVKEGANSSFCNNNTGFRDKEENWRKVLRNKKKLSAYKELIDELETGDEIKGLNSIINEYTSTSWKKYFVESPHPFQRCDRRIVRFENSEILLFKTTRSYGEHAELRTYSFYMSHVKNKIANYAPFTNEFYFLNPRNEASPCIVLYGFKYKRAEFQLEVFYRGSLQKYEIMMFMSTSKSANQIVNDKLTQLGMSIKGTTQNMNIYVDGEALLQTKLNEITNGLKAMN